MRSIFFLALLLPTVLALPAMEIREPFVTLPVSANLNATGSLRNLLKADRARARLLTQMAREKAAKVQNGTLSADAIVNVPATDVGMYYTASVGVGTPPTEYQLIVDTGSANTWVGAGKKFVETSSSDLTGQAESADYLDGSSFLGFEFLDTVTLAAGLVIEQQSIGSAEKSTGFVGVDGVLGLGPTALTIGTLMPNSEDSIPTVVDNLFSQGTIPADLIGVSFEPVTALPVVNGEITFGGTDASKFTGAITFTPVTSAEPSNKFWGIDQNIKYGEPETNILIGAAGIVDTGTAFTLISPAAFQTYFQQTGGVIDQATELIRLTPAEFDNLQNLNFEIGGTTFSLTPNAQAWPRNLNALLGGNAQDVYLIVNSVGDDSGFGFINGQTFLQRFYSVYDTTNKQVGIANTPFTDATTN